MEAPFGCRGEVVFPVKNNSEAFVMDCRISFGVIGKAEIADTNVDADRKALQARLEDAMPRILTRVLTDVWGDAMPMGAFGKSPETWEGEPGTRLCAGLAEYGVLPGSVKIGFFNPHAEDIKTLRENEDPDYLEEQRRKAVEDMHIDICFQPWIFGLPAEPSPVRETGDPWQCGVCGTENTGKFCTECGAPWKERTE